MKRVLGILLLTSIASAPLAAETPGISFGAEGSEFMSGLDGTRGFEFNVLAPIWVTGLGVFDYNGLGFADTRQVGLWSAGSDLLASLVIPSGASAPMGADLFRYVMLGSAVLLNAGTYRIGAFYAAGSDDLIGQDKDPSGAAGYVEYGRSMLLRDDFGDPTEISLVVGGAFGPNFLFEAADAHVVPEPMTMLLLGTGLAGLGAARRRRRSLEE
jgi:hypothetical protein